MVNLKNQMSRAVEYIVAQQIDDQLDKMEVDFRSVEIHRVDNLNFNIRISFTNSNTPRYFTVRVSEAA